MSCFVLVLQTENFDRLFVKIIERMQRGGSGSAKRNGLGKCVPV